MRKKAVCKDCRAEGLPLTRPATHPGPRCATHWRPVRDRRKLAAHAYQTKANFGLTEEQYWGLYKFQGGRCYMCGQASGKSKRLAVDHEHNMPGCEHPSDKGCLRCVRGLVCGPDNQTLARLGRGGLMRGLDMLSDDPPAARFLRASNTP